jgi:hypothetical protein
MSVTTEDESPYFDHPLRRVEELRNARHRVVRGDVLVPVAEKNLPELQRHAGHLEALPEGVPLRPTSA